ncbi:CoA-acylating methylmalonate-semialdehyde dehydrogenase [Microbacterium limosum]|uniref:methylmalonate-semialdehyde dehydrogenase (CoA acylating) n=1 Tax=Microbacterium limosum TaxID=3079935 RepID=A0AAU0MGM1_9MICO|nr:CoA-acylating methylmalonate-semialdehyde dehydrogenase [Microbacterium sp. Y20]WOQ69388.1 CoA-acylating methylmalonate-semialdehyde dehydrogenase [Microbacterium sp. Y20]
MSRRIPHWIDGEPADVPDRRVAPVYDPATGAPTGEVVLAEPGDVDRAVRSAAAAFPAWRDLSIARRQAVLFRFRELLEQRKGELAEIITSEHGKVLADALGEIARGQEVLEFALGFAEVLKGDYSVNASSGVDVYSFRQPIGVAAVISPFNFPAMVPLWFLPVALAAGNAVVLKPSEKDPSASLWMAQLLAEAGLPAGVFTVVNGDRVAVDALLEHPGIASVSFVGSTPIARHIYETAARHGKRVQALGGAKNHMLVLPDADLDLVADAAVNAGFGSAGERCMAISVIVAVEPVADELLGKIAERMAGLRIGDGRRGCDMGPLITREHRDRVSGYIDTAAADGAAVVVDGRGVVVDGEPGGFWLGPTLLDRVPTTSAAYTDEIFGPVLSIVRVDSYEEGVSLINTGAFGDTKAYGRQGFHFFTREKAVTARWLDPSHGGINLGFPQNA